VNGDGGRLVDIILLQCSHFEWDSTCENPESAYRDLVRSLTSIFLPSSTFTPSDTFPEQIQTFRSTTIPMFISEYGNDTHQPRLFLETTALYSENMKRVFSGGCAYEFWQGKNAYGLVELLEHGKHKRHPVYSQNHNHDHDDEGKVAERRETDRGTLLVFQDFVNYKTKLAEVGEVGMETGAGGVTTREGEKGEFGTEDGGEWQVRLSMPESCVDWGEIEGSLRK